MNGVITAFLTLSLLTPKLYAQSELKGLLDPAVEKILNNYGLDKDNIYYSFIPLGEEEETHQENFQSQKKFIPASLTKIFTALYALKQLGPDHRFKTRVYIKGRISKGVLKGDLILKGGGDPSLTMARLMDLALEVRAKGIKEVQGRFLYDDGAFEPHEILSEFGAGDQTYNPGLSALNLEFNRISLYKRGAKKTSEAEFIPIPPLAHHKIQLGQGTFSLNQRYKFKSDESGEVWEINPNFRYKKVEDIPIRRPSLHCAESFRFLLKQWGITVPQAQRASLPKGSQLIGTNQSINLINLLALTLEYSNNLYAEQILVMASGQRTIKEAATHMTKWVGHHVPECTHALINGSGLTTQHQITAKCLSSFLKTFAFSTSQHPQARGFMSLLSINGQSGWMKKRLRKPETALKIWAKTGNLDYISNIAGILFANSGQAYAFTMGMNDQKMRETIDLAQSKGPKELSIKEKAVALKTIRKAHRWTRKAKETTDKLLEHFMQTL